MVTERRGGRRDAVVVGEMRWSERRGGDGETRWSERRGGDGETRWWWERRGGRRDAVVGETRW